MNGAINAVLMKFSYKNHCVYIPCVPEYVGYKFKKFKTAEVVALTLLHMVLQPSVSVVQ